MLPDPLHPAVVHLPIALAVLLPLIGVMILSAIRAGWLERRSWSLVALLAGLLVLSSWLALETGEADEERVERVVAEQAIEAHEEVAELFALLSIVVFAVTATGLSAGSLGTFARASSVVVALALLVVGARVGHLGGQLVYVHGAASAYTDAHIAPRDVQLGDRKARRPTRHRDDDDD